MGNVKNGAKIGGSVVGVIVAVLAVALLIGGAIWGIKYVTADARGAGEKRELVEANGQLRVQAYDKFFDQCGAVQATEDKIATLEDEAALPTTTAQRRGEITSFVGGLKSQRSELIRQYNADSAKTYTSGQFKASNLPYQLDTETESTQCAL